VSKLLLCLLLGYAAPAAETWRPLFNGRNLDGWSVLGAGGTPLAFTVEDGMLRTQPGHGQLLWYTREKIAKATLRLVYRMSNRQGNSGVFIRIPTPPPTYLYAAHHGIEVQIDDRDDDWHCTGTLYSMTRALARPSKPAGEWNTMDITLDGMRTVVKVNGVLVTDYDGVSPVPERKRDYEPERRPRPEAGYFGLQFHDDKAVIWFREVSVRPAARPTR
jgi:hypothetical protein